MRIVETFPHRVRVVENCWIPLAGGERIAARLWLPEDAEQRPVPAILESIPYRKRDGTRWRDEPMHRYFAGHGYASVRIDVRGSGDSDGLLLDEYLPQEQEDTLAVLRWIAAQPWCTGAVGMIGKSWGGFAALQTAAHAPPELGAVIVVHASDDRYTDDAHYMGGCLLNENFVWGSMFFTQTAQPPDPEIVGDGWRNRWMQRLETLPLYPEIWMRHPQRDAYWQQGSVRDVYERIRCPVFVVGGWADGYSNAVPRLLEKLAVPTRGLVGPWAHVYPHRGVPRPAIGFLQEALQWFDAHLRGDATGAPASAEPPYRVWMQYCDAALDGVRAGRWVAETAWPSPRLQPKHYALGPDHELTASGSASDRTDAVVTVSTPQSVGAAGGGWCGFEFESSWPGDQAADDARSLCFDTEPLQAPFEILGAPTLTLDVSPDRPHAFVVARLNDVAPDGRVSRVTYGVLNLRHRDGHERPQAVVPDKRLRIRLQLNDVAHRFGAGHRVRLALSTTYWPIVWPSPEAAVLRLSLANCALELPERPPRAEDAALRGFAAPEGGPTVESEDLHPGGMQHVVERDPANLEIVSTTWIDVDESGQPALTRIPDIDLDVGHGIVERFRIRDDDPLSAVAEIEHETVRRRRDWEIRIATCMRLRATRDSFHLEAAIDAFENGTRVFTRRWDSHIPRDPTN